MPCLTAGLIYAGVAQLVVQLIRNEQVAGSSPATSLRRHFCFGSGVFFMQKKGRKFCLSSLSTYIRSDLTQQSLVKSEERFVYLVNVVYAVCDMVLDYQVEIQ